ncbi:MAG TPA: hypothetical protein VM782_20675 [Stellaceae bacterium]|nr:hypothetical protein [Stellaceae bacterium]
MNLTATPVSRGQPEQAEAAAPERASVLAAAVAAVPEPERMLRAALEARRQLTRPSATA